MTRGAIGSDRLGRPWGDRDSADRWARDVSTVTGVAVDVVAVVDRRQLCVYFRVTFGRAEVAPDEALLSRFRCGVQTLDRSWPAEKPAE